MRLREPSALVRLRDGTAAERPLLQLTADHVVAAAPWRSARSAREQAHYPGYYWSATSGGHVIYESRLKLARLLLADFDSDRSLRPSPPTTSTYSVRGRFRAAGGRHAAPDARFQVADTDRIAQWH